MRVLIYSVLVLHFVSVSAMADDSIGTTQWIDAYFVKTYERDQIVPAPLVDDATFLRRISLDLIGRFPTVEEARAFLKDTDQNKRSVAIDRLLSREEHYFYFARTWRKLLVPEAKDDRTLRYLLPGFEAWLQDQRRAEVGFDKIVRDLIAVEITGTVDRPQLVLTDLKKPNRIAYLAAKGADPAALASSTIRLFQGIRLECAQCHDHPFGQWTQQQFWNQAAFFAGIQRQGRSPFAPIFERHDLRSIQIMDKETIVNAVYLDGKQHTHELEISAREALAEWIVSSETSLFPQAIANRIWGELMGIGLIDPVDDMHPANLSSHPELLAAVATRFRSTGFDLRQLYRDLCNSEIYQRSSRESHPSQADENHWAKRAVKPFTSEQFIDSLSVAVGDASIGTGGKREENSVSRGMVELFDSHGSTRDPETSVLQILAMMNGQWMQEVVSGVRSKRIRDLLNKPELKADEQIDELYLATLSRFPTDNRRVSSQRRF